MLMMSSMGASGGDISQLLPTMLLLNGKDSNKDSLLLKLLVTSQGGNSDLSALLPILLLKDDSFETEDLLMLTAMQNGDIQNALPLLLLSDKDASSSKVCWCIRFTTVNIKICKCKSIIEKTLKIYMPQPVFA